MSSTLLKLFNASGDLDVMTTAEEYYCAYQAGSWIASNITTSTPGIVTTGTAAGSERAVGSFVNTYFNQAVGTHPGSSITSGSTTTTLKQTNPTYDPTGLTNWRRPATWDTGNSGIKELTDAEMNTVCDRLLAYMMVNEWYGPNFRVATSTPAGYTSYQANFASDTQSSGATAANYTLYKKTTAPTAPTTARPVCLKRATYPSGTYSGIVEMTDTQIAETFGAWILTRMVNADDTVGRYLLTTSTPAALGYAGTWQSRGTMVDTKDTTSEVDYSAVYSADYTRNSTSDYLGDFTGDYVGNVDYSANYTRNSTTNFTRNSTRVSGNLLYWGDYQGQYAPLYRTYTRYSGATGLVYWGDYQGQYAPLYRTYTRYSVPANTLAYWGDYQGQYAPLYRTYTRYSVSYTGDFTGDFVGDFTGDYVGNYVNENINFTRNSTNLFTGDFTGNYVGNYTGNYVGTTISATDTTVNTYTLYCRVA